MRIAPINFVYMDSINGIYSVVGAFFGKNDPENQEKGVRRVRRGPPLRECDEIGRLLRYGEADAEFPRHDFCDG